MESKLYNITGMHYGALIHSPNVRKAKRWFRRKYPNEKIIYAKLAGKVNKRGFKKTEWRRQ